jgi:FkbM family methyltransferase
MHDIKRPPVIATGLTFDDASRRSREGALANTTDRGVEIWDATTPITAKNYPEMFEAIARGDEEYPPFVPGPVEIINPAHPVFSEFQPFAGVVEAGFVTDFIGTVTDERFVLGFHFTERAFVTMPSPYLDHEFFEWLTACESVKAAKSSYTMIELGAGYGRWAARAMMAARQKNISNAYAILVEAEPVHAGWARDHMTLNSFKDFRVVEAAIGASQGTASFIVNRTNSPGYDPRSWYGQTFDWADPASHRDTQRTHAGHPLKDNGGGWGVIDVDVITLESVLEPHSIIDLIDMDIQGAEGDVIEASRDILSGKVRRIHIGTHGREIESRIRSAMTSMGWVKVWDFPGERENVTPYGTILFEDGVQDWVNPLL